MDKAFFIDRKTMKALMQTPDKRSKQGLRDLAVLLCLSLGLRRQEVCNLDVVDFDAYSGYLKVRTIKRGKPRSVKLTPEIVQAIEAYLDSKRNGKKEMHDPEALFHGLAKHGPWPMRRLSPMAVNWIVRKALKKAGMEQNVTPHSFRHSMATTALRGGVDLRTVQAMLGHRSITSTAQYLHSLNTDEAFQALPWLKKNGQRNGGRGKVA